MTLDHHAEAILRAAGSSLRHYEARTREAILAAVREAMEAGRIQGLIEVQAIAAQWRDENKAQESVEVKRGNKSMAIRFGGSATECNALVAEIAKMLPTPPRGE